MDAEVLQIIIVSVHGQWTDCNRDGVTNILNGAITKLARVLSQLSEHQMDRNTEH